MFTNEIILDWIFLIFTICYWTFLELLQTLFEYFHVIKFTRKDSPNFSEKPFFAVSQPFAWGNPNQRSKSRERNIK